MEALEKFSFEYDASSSLPKFRQFAEALSSYLRSWAIPAGEKLPCDRELSKRYDIAVMTMSRALNELAVQGILERRVGAGTFVCEARKYRPGQKRIGIVCHEPITLDGGFVSTLLAELYAQAENYHFDLIQLIRSPEEYVDTMKALQLSGLVVLSALPESMPVLAEMQENGVNLVQIGVWYKKQSSISIGTDHVLAARKAVSYMVSRGHRKIGFIACRMQNGQLHRSTEERIQGYRKGMWDAELPCNPEWLIEDDMEANALQESIRKLMAENALPTAFLLGSLPMAPKVYHILAALKLRIPEDISLLTFDNSFLCTQLTPALTSFSQNVAELTKCAFDQLASPQKKRVNKLVQSVLISRESCAEKS